MTYLDAILTETTSAVHTLTLVEGSPAVQSGSALCTLTGPFADCNIPTRNNRMYTLDLWRKVLSSSHVKEMLDTKTFFGEADHPFAVEGRLEVSLPKVSHVITKLWIDEESKIVYGSLDILDTPSGRILKTMIDYGSILGISSRAAGQVVTKNNKPVVDEDTYNFVTFDIVPLPGNIKSRLEPETSYSPVSMIDAIGEQVSSALDKQDKSELAVIQGVLESLDIPDLQPLCEQVSQALVNSDTITAAEKDLEEAYTTVKDLRTQVTNLENELSQYKANSERASTSTSLTSEAFVQALDVSFTTVLSEINSLKEDLASKQTKEFDELRKSYAKLHGESSTYKKDLDEALATIDSYNSAVDELAEERDRLKSQVSDLTSENADLSEKLESQSSEIDQLVSTNKDLQNALTEESARNATLKATKQDLQSRVSTLESTANDLQQDLSLAKSQLDIMETQGINETKKLQGYKEFAKAYIDLRSTQIGVPPKVALSALPESITPELVENTLRELAQTQVNQQKMAYTNRTASPQATVLSESNSLGGHKRSKSSQDLVSIIKGASSI
ncbi:peptidase [Listeria phage LIS04]|nr:peptidase [Listeria phage LIS04]